jgi:hypothetical protein
MSTSVAVKYALLHGLVEKAHLIEIQIEQQADLQDWLALRGNVAKAAVVGGTINALKDDLLAILAEVRATL